MKSLESPSRRRGIHTLDLFLDTLLAAGPLPAGFRVTLPKITSVRQVEAMSSCAPRWTPSTGCRGCVSSCRWKLRRRSSARTGQCPAAADEVRCHVQLLPVRLPAAAGRLRAYQERHCLGLLDELATAKALARFLRRAVDCGAAERSEVSALAAVTPDELTDWVVVDRTRAALAVVEGLPTVGWRDAESRAG